MDSSKTIRAVINEIKKHGNLWNLASSIAHEDLEKLLDEGIRAKLPVTAASYYAEFYRYLDLAFNYMLETSRDRQLKKLYRKFTGFKRVALTDIVAKSSAGNYDFNILSSVINGMAEALYSMGYLVLKIDFTTVNRTIVGDPPLAFKLLFEAGTTMHPFYQVPYVPGSSLKGLLRSYIELRGLSCKVGSLSYDVGSIMGSPEAVGGLVVSDALPIGVVNAWGTLLEPEVTTPIYADGTDNPRIEEHRARPVPVIYPVIARSVVFRVALGVGRGVSRDCWKTVGSWVREALLVGIGRKTSLSYGMSKVIDLKAVDGEVS